MTVIGRLIERQDNYGAAEAQAIKVHVDAMKLVIQNQMKGDGALIAKLSLMASAALATSWRLKLSPSYAIPSR
jgi:hypothetical protein